MGTPSALLYSSERGDLENKFVTISEDDAERIISRIRQTYGGRLNELVRSAMRGSATDSS